MTWRRTFPAILSMVMLVLHVHNINAYEQISSFHSHIVLNPDADLDITEKITYETDEEKHGIYRYIPERYHRNGLNLHIKVADVVVTDENSQPLPFTKERKNGSLYLKIGDPNQTFTGSKIYSIKYSLHNALFPLTIDGREHPQLILDITGEGWQVPIASASATITAPATIKQSNCYSGAYGATTSTCLIQQTTPTTLLTVAEQPINHNDNLTVAVIYDANSGITLPSIWQRWLRKFWDNLGLAIIIFPAIVMTWWWWQKGRDRIFVSLNVFSNHKDGPQTVRSPWQWRPIPMVYEPFTDLSPAEAGTLLHERVDIRHIIADIVFLAAQKFIQIERVDTKQLLGKKTDYRLKRLPKNVKDLPQPQQSLLKALFATKESILISELKGTFYKEIDGLQAAYMASLTNKKIFAQNPRQIRAKAFAIAGVTMMIMLAWMFHLLNLGINWSLPITFLSSAIMLATAYSMPAKTALGSQYYWKVRGLQQSIKRGAWREKIKEKHLFIEEIFPFAVALNVVNQLVRDMHELAYEPPDYLGNAWTTASINQFTNSFVNQVSQSLSYNPNSSGAGGSSSGGGVGGGGGGSW